MCGIIGYLDRRGGHDRPVGRVLLSMLQALSCRGPDSAGVAIFGSASGRHLVLSAPPNQSEEHILAAFRVIGVTSHRHYGNGVYFASMSSETRAANLEDQ